MGGSQLSVNFDIGLEEEKELKDLLEANEVTKKLCLSTCPSM